MIARPIQNNDPNSIRKRFLVKADRCQNITPLLILDCEGIPIIGESYSKKHPNWTCYELKIETEPKDGYFVVRCEYRQEAPIMIGEAI